MATTTLTLYQTDITPERNARVDQLTDYLSSITTKTIINDFQYIKCDLETSIKINMSQTNCPTFPYNYLQVKRNDEAFSGKQNYYYFILNTKWISTQTIELQLAMDTVNTFWTDLKWTDKTNITRQHKDRFKRPSSIPASGNAYFKRYVDEYDEGFAPTKYPILDTKLVASLNYDWYLIYKNKNVSTTTVPIDCFCCASMPINLNLYVDYNGINLNDYGENTTFIITAQDNTNFSVQIGDLTYQIGKDKIYKAITVNVLANHVGQIYLTKTNESNEILGGGWTGNILTNIAGQVLCHQIDNFSYTPTTYVNVLGTLASRTDAYPFYIGTGGGVLNSFDTIDRSNTQIVKIIKMPYAPFELTLTNGALEIPDGWNYESGLLKLESLDTEFITTVADRTLSGVFLQKIPVDQLKNYQNQTHSQKMESKLYNSNFFTLKYMYDNFEKEILCERVQPSSLNVATQDSPTLNIQFKQSNNISSNSLFDIAMKYNASYGVPYVYGRYLNVNRQNEVALYNSDYLNYIRNGYNYDKKAKSRQTTANWIGVGLGAAGTIASAFTGTIGAVAAISLATSTISSISGAINQTISAEDSLKQKLQQAQNSPASVSNTEDLNLLSYYNENRLHEIRESCSDNVKSSLYTLFRLTGYACNEYRVPAFDSRVWYNFLQCDAVFNEKDWKYGQNILNDIKERLKVGITIYHTHNNKYDFEQKLENYESWMIQ